MRHSSEHVQAGRNARQSTGDISSLCFSLPTYLKFARVSLQKGCQPIRPIKVVDNGNLQPLYAVTVICPTTILPTPVALGRAPCMLIHFRIKETTQGYHYLLPVSGLVARQYIQFLRLKVFYYYVKLFSQHLLLNGYYLRCCAYLSIFRKAICFKRSN